MSDSPGRKRLQKPPSLQELAKQTDDSRSCLAHPYAYRRGCSTPINIGDDARQQLKTILCGDHLLQKGAFQDSIDALAGIAKVFCCSKHGGSAEDFAYYWVVFSLIDAFLLTRGWSWDDCEWQCLVTDCDILVHCDDQKQRHIVYRSLCQILMYTNFSNNVKTLNDAYLDNAIANLVKWWTCADHRKSPDAADALKVTLKEELINSCHSPGQEHKSDKPSQVSHHTGSSEQSQDTQPFLSSGDYLSPQGGGTQGIAERRRSAPLPSHSAPSPQSTPTTPKRPAVRSTASDAPLIKHPSITRSLPHRKYQNVGSPSIAPRYNECMAPEKVYFTQPSPESKQKELRQIMNDVLSIIRRPARSGTRNEGALYQPGWIYILKIQGQPGHLKIGRTTQSVGNRARQIASCGLNLEIVGGDQEIRVPYHERLEQIIHAELVNERRSFQCSCRRKNGKEDNHSANGFTKHGEWFELDEEEARRKVDRWRKWMGQQPYKEPGIAGEGDLKGDFTRRVDYYLDEAEASWEDFTEPLKMAPLNRKTIGLYFP